MSAGRIAHRAGDATRGGEVATRHLGDGWADIARAALWRTGACDDFRMIPPGDLDVRNEICLERNSDTMQLRSGRTAMRKVYKCRVVGVNSKMTVAVYHGENTEEEWRQHISKHSWLR
ncbi:hypothetical protein B0H14DRAFT_2614991 [Mycena olivaceomarginata]|nr:hypothetical protein B0H14DRAFT_2614991 [Mycena olivaceomarginata]